MKPGHVRAALTLPLFSVAAFILVLVYLPARRFGWRFAGSLQMAFHRLVLWTLGIRLHVHGRPTAERPLLLAANHASWIDISAYSAVMPLSFVAKREVGAWPLLGFFARLQRSVFIDRTRRGATADQADSIGRRLANGDVIMLFPEGTTSDGNQVLPFRSALFGSARTALEETGIDVVFVQPVAIAYTHMLGLPLGRSGRSIVSWVGDQDLAPHAKEMFAASDFDVSIIFGEPIRFDRSADRKKVSLEAEAAVRRLLAAELRGGRV
ncbi:lysophospholipid acyltransferase family protein [Pleomorphomonas sp. PLEO]|uniref:lysophospholipid acyltransferase family protein n=1 Tax=Pleomorphomonas sp. PLEO TaxID=3239306 RepID=UPI00351F75A3